MLKDEHLFCSGEGLDSDSTDYSADWTVPFRIGLERVVSSLPDMQVARSMHGNE